MSVAKVIQGPSQLSNVSSRGQLDNSNMPKINIATPFIESVRVAGSVVDAIESGVDYLKKVPYMGTAVSSAIKGVAHTATFGVFSWASAMRAKIEASRAEKGIELLSKNIREFSNLNGSIKERAEKLTSSIVEKYNYPKSKVPELSKKIESILAKEADKTLGENEFVLEIENLKQEIVKGYNVRGKVTKAAIYSTVGVVATGVGLYLNSLFNAFTETANQVVAPGIDIVTKQIPEGVGPAAADALNEVVKGVSDIANASTPALEATTHVADGMGDVVAGGISEVQNVAGSVGEVATNATTSGTGIVTNVPAGVGAAVTEASSNVVVPDVSKVIPTLW